MKILHVVGARPNFIKVAPVIAALREREGVVQILVHTGQHYDINMTDIFFDQLGIPEPNVNLEVGSESQAAQTANIMVRLERILLDDRPDLVLVYGDVNSTLAAALVCAKQLIPVGHIEAGLRSFDRTMPEEINRLLTDQIADFLFTPSPEADENLMREGVPQGKIHLVGNVMIDTLVRLLPHAQERWPSLQFSMKLNGQFGLVTLHRPSNVDSSSRLSSIISALNTISNDMPLYFPIHPRTRQRLASLLLNIDKTKLNIIDPIGYMDFLAMQNHAMLVITDSGGIQEETTFLRVPCLTMRENTERPITVKLGTNILVGQDMEKLKREVYRILNGEVKQGSVPPLWDGKTSERIAEIVIGWNNRRK
ncbi:MAG: UDP-N-acetylglucosamine 2-epimerase (non-hydrolyzing) [Thermodesulfobacteriota bacterium]